MAYPNYYYQGFGGNNPCGAYYPANGPLDMGRANDKCQPDGGHATISSTNGNTESTTTRGKGICCDLFKRVNPNVPSYSWQDEVNYRVFDTIAATGQACPACFFHAYRQHTSFDSSGIGANVKIEFLDPATLQVTGSNFNDDNKPCEKKWEPNGGSLNDDSFFTGADHATTKYIEKWSACRFLIEEGLPGNCTMHNSFGLIMNDTQNITHIGSPNGSCQSNCMQLGKEYFEETVGGKFLIYADYPPNNFDNKTAYDCERKYTDRQQNSGPTGSKLIWAGFAPNQWDPGNSSPSNFTEQDALYVPFTAGIRRTIWTLDTDPVPGFTTPITLNWDETLGDNPQNVTYRMDDTLAGDQYEGYLPVGADKSNSWGLHAGDPTQNIQGFAPQEDSHLWARKSVWRFGDSNNAPRASNDDAFRCCQYVSFGCTDPSFGSYDPQAQLDCDGVPTTNTFDKDDQGNPTCNDINGNSGPSGPVCWDNAGLQCSKCIDEDDTSPNFNEYFNSPNDDPDGECTQQILDSCGARGNLSLDAWNLMRNTRPSSWFYGGGAAELGLQQPGYGNAAFWDKDGRNVTNFTTPPKCQCNNNGCMDPRADNFSSLNTKDCIGELPTQQNIYGDVKCCVITKFGCPEPDRITFPKENYFCFIDINNDGPDNAEFCMDTNGIPCNSPNSSCVGGGIPLSSRNPITNVVSFNNPEVNLIDDGSCDLRVISGCKDDGGFLAGGIWPGPIYPGYSAMNFNPEATVHIQSECEYVFGCPDPLAQNVMLGGGVCPDSVPNNPNNTVEGVRDYYNNQVFVDLEYFGRTIDVNFVQDNLIPNIECCDYQLVGGGDGCTDPNALNYNPLANQDDGSCIYNIEGCTDPTALNFNPAATSDDSSCIYEGQFPGEGTNFLDGTPIELCREPLTKEEVLMNVCQPTEIQSEVFIERGKQSVFETNQRLDEVKTIGGLKIYGYGFYNIKEQI